MLTITDLVKTFPASDKSTSPVRAVDGVDLSVEQGQLFTLLGPSGCGKTTTLRSVAGLERPDSGVIEVGDRVLFSSDRRISVPPSRRGLGMVFQSYAIWPHMDVFSNVAFPLQVAPRSQRSSKSEIEAAVMRVLGVMQLEKLRDRQATKLSGGQQQRLALARALVVEPPLLLLDEPLSNLDAKLRQQMRVELKRLVHELGITAVYVTHDQVEALALSDVIAVMCDGVIEQAGTPHEVYEKPATRFVADFIGVTNFLEGIVLGLSERGAGQYVVKTEDGLVEAESAAPVTTDSSVTLSVRPEAFELSRDQRPDRDDEWRGTVIHVSYLGDAVEEHVELRSGSVLLVRVAPSHSVEAGTDVTVNVTPGGAYVVSDKGG